MARPRKRVVSVVRASTSRCCVPDFLEQLEHRDIPATSFEAVHRSFWPVMPLDDQRFGLFRLWEDSKHGDEPSAVLNDHFTALLAAAVLPVVAASRTMWLYPPDDAGGYRMHRDGREMMISLRVQLIAVTRKPAMAWLIVLLAGRRDSRWMNRWGGHGGRAPTTPLRGGIGSLSTPKM